MKSLLLLLALSGCAAPVYPPYVVPTPAPVVPTPPVVLVYPAKFTAIKVGDAEATLPAGATKTPVEAVTIYSWDTGVARPGGGTVQWEAKVEAGKVTSTGPL